MIGQDHIYREIKSKLHDLRQRRKKLRLWSGCLLYLAGLLVMCFFLVGLESIFHFSAVVRIILIFAGVFLGGTFLILWIGNPVFSLLFQKDKPDDDYLALQAGEQKAVLLQQ